MLGDLVRLRVVDPVQDAGDRFVHGGQSLDLVRRHVEAAVDHAERLEDRRGEVLVQRLIGDDLDHSAKDVMRPAIPPARSWLVHERLCGEPAHQLRQCVPEVTEIVVGRLERRMRRFSEQP